MQLLGITNNFYSKATNTKLSIYSTTDDTLMYEKDFDVEISSLHSSSNFLLLGLCTGPVILLNYSNNNEFVIYNFLQKVTCVFNYGQYYYFGSESGKIVMFIINQECNTDNPTYSDIFSNNDFYNYRIIKEIQHNAPIVHIASDGDTTYIFDCRGKITVYPENSAYDMLASCMQFKKYLFVSEKKFLYCKTTQAFACVLSLNEPIVEFCFSDNGGVMFIRTKTHIHVYNKNFKILNKIAFKNGNFVFDEINNRLVLLSKDKIKMVNNVIDQVSYLNEEMDEFVFEETKINEKKVHLEDDEDNYVIKTTGPKVRVTKFIADECSASDSYEEEKNYNNDLELFEDVDDDIEIEKEEKTPVRYGIEKHRNEAIAFMPTHIVADGITMFCYNKYGYVIKKEFFTEFIYHNIEMPKKEFRNVIRLATISDKGCLFVESNTLNFDGDISWQKEIEDIVLIDITNDYIICVTDTELILFKFSGIKVASSLIQNPITVCCEDTKIALFCRDYIYIYDSYCKCDIIPFDYELNFCCFASGLLYFAIDQKLYMLKDNLCIFIIKFDDNALVVTNHHLLTCNDKLYPVPNINFTSLRTDEYAFDHAKSHDERDAELRIKIESAIGEGNRILADDYISLLSNKDLKKRYDMPVISTYNTLVSEVIEHEKTQMQTSLLYEDTSEIHKENEKTPKKKRFNPFAKK